VWGQFTQEDPIGIAGGLNLYGFANGDPINFSDPFGLCPPIESCRELARAIAGFAESAGASASITVPAGGRNAVPLRPALGFEALQETIFSIDATADHTRVNMSGAMLFDVNGDVLPFVAEQASVDLETGSVAISGRAFGLFPTSITGTLGEEAPTIQSLCILGKCIRPGADDEGN
jgi:hypothetical protein